MSGAYYNEFDPKAAATLRELIRRGVIADGEVDERSILDVHPIELRGFTECHFFAGFGVWSYALRLAGWPDDRRVWTASCPCQPFSAAGARAGFDDERHLWPALYHLIRELRPAIVFGEQVASKDADPWIDLVQDDMEALGHAFGAVPFPSAGVGAPHIRDRLYWMAHDDDDARLEGWGAVRQRAAECVARARGVAGELGYANEGRSGRHTGAVPSAQGSTAGRVRGVADGVESAGAASGLADSDGRGFERFAGLRLRGSDVHDADGRSPLGGFWAGAEWIACRDGKWRPVEPGTFPLAHGAPERVGRLRGYGNAINAEAARAFIESYLESEIA